MVRAFVVNITGKTGRCSVTFDRYGMNSKLFDISDDTVTLRNHAISNALYAVLKERGQGWVTDYKVIDVE